MTDLTIGADVYVSGPRRFGRGRFVRERRDGRLVVLFDWDKAEHPCKAEHVQPLGHQPIPLPVLDTPPHYGPLRQPEAVPKPESGERVPLYLAWVRRQPCCRCGREGMTEASHHREPMQGTTGRKPSDLRCIGLCTPCHREFHTHPQRFDRDWIEDRISESVCQWVRETGDV